MNSPGFIENEDLNTIRHVLRTHAIAEQDRKAVFFKTKPGEYAAHDQFLGVSMPILRQIAKENRYLSLEILQQLLQSKINEERLLALLILVDQYQKGDKHSKQMIYDFYCLHIKYINNWNLVDASAHLIVGAHLHHGDKTSLLKWAKSSNFWERRIAIVATWYDIRQNEFEWTNTIAALLLNDQQDLIHKATGWMLREMGKRNHQILINFLEKYALEMPRTMLRYAIEKLPQPLREDYLSRKKPNAM